MACVPVQSYLCAILCTAFDVGFWLPMSCNGTLYRILKIIRDSPNPSPIHSNIRVTRVNDLIRVVTLHATVMASGPLTYLVGCGVASNDSDQVSYLQHRMVLTEATGDAELVLWDGREFGHRKFNNHCRSLNRLA